MNYRAVYHDRDGNTYSAPAEQRGDTWMMLTSNGWQPIAATFADEAAGMLTFSHYREEPTRLHVEAGKNSFAQLLDAGAKATAEYQRQRQQQRREMLDALNQPDARKIAEARVNATALAQRWNPKRPEPVPPQIPNKEVMAEAARYRKRKLEPES